MRSEYRLRDAKKVIEALVDGGFKAMLAGGCVRDRLLGIEPKDYDIATTARPPEVCSVFEHFKAKVVPTGIEHGTVTIVMPSGPIEVTTLRRDVATDGRRATVTFADDFAEDAARRDFTVNAMYEDSAGNVHDFFGGRQHLADKRLVFVGDARTRIREDYLRIMRFYRFWATLGMSVDATSEDVIREEVAGLGRVSQERVTSELLLLANAADPAEVLRSMERCGVLECVLPLSYHMPKAQTLADLYALPEGLRPLARLAAFFLPQRTEAEVNVMGQRLKLAHHQTRVLQVILVGPTQFDAMPTEDALRMEFLDWCEEGSSYEADTYLTIWAITHRSTHSQIITSLQKLERTKGHDRRASRTNLSLNGNDIMTELGVAPGAIVGEHLTELRRAFRRGNWRTKQEGIAYLRDRTEAPAGRAAIEDGAEDSPRRRKNDEEA